jgi:hypothetical protein
MIAKARGTGFDAGFKTKMVADQEKNKPPKTELTVGKYLSSKLLPTFQHHLEMEKNRRRNRAPGAGYGTLAK